MDVDVGVLGKTVPITPLGKVGTAIAVPPVTWMVTHDWLLAGFVSLALVTVAQFVTVLPGGALTLPVKAIVSLPPGGIVPELVPVAPVALPVQFQLPVIGAIGVMFRPAGQVSCTVVVVTAPPAGPGHGAVPTFVTVRVNVTC